MADISAQVEIPRRALFKAAEVCDIIKVQPYVLRSWEAEFPGLGVTKSAGVPRVYRRADVEQALRIKNLLLVDGLTLAGVRRKLEDEGAPFAGDAPLDELIGRNARERLADVKRGLRSLLDLLSSHAGEFRLAPPPVAVPSRVRTLRVAKTAPKGSKASSSKRAGHRAAAARPAVRASARGKRSA